MIASGVPGKTSTDRASSDSIDYPIFRPGVTSS